MRLVAQRTLRQFAAKHPDATASLDYWSAKVRVADWHSMQDVQDAFPKAKTINAERARFIIAGGSYRLIASFNFQAGIVFVKFLGTHKEYDNIDAATISQF